jgi:chromate transporter
VLCLQAGRIDYADAKELHWFATFYRTGSVIFGGGQVVLPMLYNDMVDRVCTTIPANGTTPAIEVR